MQKLLQTFKGTGRGNTHLCNGRYFFEKTKTGVNTNLEDFSVVINLMCKTWLLACSYNHHQNLIATYLETIGVGLEKQGKIFARLLYCR